MKPKFDWLRRKWRLSDEVDKTPYYAPIEGSEKSIASLKVAHNPMAKMLLSAANVAPKSLLVA